MKFYYFILTFIITFLIMFTGCIQTNSNNSKETMKYKYHVEISSLNYINYTLYLPIPIHEDGSVSEMIDYLKIVKGNGKFEIIESNYGKALKLTGNGFIVLEINDSQILKMPNKNNLPGIYLSLENKSSNEIYYNLYGSFENNSEINMKLIYHFSHQTGPRGAIGIDIIIIGRLNNGWNSIKGTKEIESA